jgi:hypothetical protein
MTKRLAALLLFLIFAPSVALFAEPLSPGFAVESSASFRADQQDLSQDMNPVSGVLGRHLRAKSSIKSLPGLAAVRQEFPLAGWVNERTFSPPYKSSVYQQINVYRL